MGLTDEAGPLLLHLLEQAYDRKAWHGPNLRGSLRGLTASEAAWRPRPGRHSVWELALHCAYWKYAVLRKLTGAQRGSFPRKPSNFPGLPQPADAKAWTTDLALLDRMHRDLVQATTRYLDGATRDPKIIRLIEGVACHDVYHAGQIRLLIRLSGAKKRG